MKININRFLLILFFIAISTVSFASSKTVYPKPTGFVNDYANIIDDQYKAKITNLISDFEKNTTVEIAVLTVPDLQGLDIETYAVEVFKEWGIGKKKENNGVLILVGLQERKIRIEVGYGLEGVITDIASKDIIDNIITPRFKEYSYGEGIYNAVSAIVKTIQKGGYESPSAPKDSGDDWKITAIVIVGVLVLIFLFIKFLGFLVIGILWFILLLITYSIIHNFLFALIIATLVMSKISPKDFNFSSSGGVYGSGGHYYGGSWSSGSSWGGFGGGFSGGGGASGGW